MEEVSSTNDYLKQLLSNIKPLAEGTAIMAKHQTQGRGQRGSTWHTSSGENLTFSFNLHPNNLDANNSFLLNVIVCLGIQRWMNQNGMQTFIKWPNDIYVNDRKIAGILIENQLSGKFIRTAVIGIGMNVNQTTFQADLAQKATSIRILSPGSPELNLHDCCITLLQTIMEVYSTYDEDSRDVLFKQYNSNLYRKDVPSLFLIDGQKTEGTIKDVDERGLLRVYVAGELRSFDLKEISFII